MPQPIRTNGLTSAASAMQMLERRQQVIANNLANSNTRGFKAERSFARLIGDAVAATGTSIDRKQGTLTETHNPLDLSVEGDGFFVVQKGPEERLLRDGTFQLNDDRQLVDSSGNLVLGDDGPITLPKGEITVSATGQIRVDAKPVAQLRLERVDAKAPLTHEAGTLFKTDATARQSIPLNDRQIHQGSVEESNVNTMATMSEMIEVMHRYGSAQKMVATIDAIRGIAVNDLAKVV
ncbi:MAG: flagellar hook basal-body protein [Gemmatimonadaceae bacterium]